MSSTWTSKMVCPRLNCLLMSMVCSENCLLPCLLSYSLLENPYSAAQRFLAQHELPLSYLDEVVRFIEQNTSGVSLGGGSEFVDPFTGESSAVYIHAPRDCS